jgi:uncharacterized repeat protein (TIGR02543 family)
MPKLTPIFIITSQGKPMDLSTLKRLGRLPLIAGLVLMAQAAFAGTLTGVSVTADDYTPGATTTYTFTYTTETDLTLVGDDPGVIFVNFPSGFEVGIPIDLDPSIKVWLDGNPATLVENFSIPATDGGLVALGVEENIPAGTVIEVEVPNITNPIAAGDYLFDPSDTLMSDTGIRTVRSLTLAPMEVDVAAQKTVTIGVPSSSSSSVSSSSSSAASSSAALVNGTCGIAHMGTFAIDPPTETLCDTGTPASYSANATDFTWDCEGENGGSPVSCAANLGFLITPSSTAGGTFDCVPDLVAYGTSTTCTAVANSGYDFSSWGAGDCNGVLTLDCVLNNVVSAPTLEVLFSSIPNYTITTAVSPSSTAGTATCTPNPVTSGGDASCTATAKTGYKFSEWSGDCSGKSCSFTALGANKSVTANFAKKTYSLLAAVSPADSGSVICSSSVEFGSDGNCTATAATGYNFSGWTNCPDPQDATCNFKDVTSNKSVTANFSAISYTVTGVAEQENDGTVSCASPVNHGASTSCTAIPAEGMTLSGWTGCTSSSGATCTLSNVTANQSVTAKFARRSITVTVTPLVEGTGSGSCDNPVVYRGNATCTVTPAIGYHIVKLLYCDYQSFNPQKSICVLENLIVDTNINVEFGINEYSVIGRSNPRGTGTVSCPELVTHGASASCTAEAAAGYRLKDWSGACTGSSCSIASVTANSSVTANFEKIPTYNVSTSVSPVDSGRISCTKNVQEGTTATCNAIAKDGFEFTGWGGDCAGTELSCAIPNVTANKSVSATFAQTQATGFNITVGFINALGKPDGTAIAGDQICSVANPIAGGTTVKCNPDNYRLSGGNTFRGWEGGCTKVEGRTCIIENMLSDKHLTIKMGVSESGGMGIVKVTPYGAGGLWCTISTANLPSLDRVGDYCIGEANPGYVFDAFVKVCGICMSPSDYYVEARFKPVENTPSVICENCNSSTTDTFTTKTTTVSQTGTPDANGTSTQSNVATSTNLGTGGTSTTVTVNTQNTGGTQQPGGSASTPDPNPTVTVGGSSTTLVTGNPNTGATSTAVVGGTGTVVTTSLPGGSSNTLGTQAGQSVNITQNSAGTSFNVQDGSSGIPLGTTSVLLSQGGNTVTTTVLSSTLTVDNKGIITTNYGEGTVTSSSVIGSTTVTASQSFTVGTGASLNVLVGGSGNGGGFGAGTTGSGYGGSVTVGTGGGLGGGLGGGSLGGGAVTGFTVTAGNYNPGNKPGQRKTSAADERVVFADITGDALQSVQIFSNASGVVEIFKPTANGPVLTDIQATDESVNLTLTIPAAN